MRWALLRNVFVIGYAVCLVACNGSYTAFESDAETNRDVKTVDIEPETAEPITLAAFQASFQAHYHSMAFEFLDANDLPADATEELSSSSSTLFKFKRDCENFAEEGSVEYTFSRGPGLKHQVGDSVATSYKNCRIGNKVFNGTMDAKYAELKGLNKYFININAEQCASALIEELSLPTYAYDYFAYNLDSDSFVSEANNFAAGSTVTLNIEAVISIPADDIKFTKVGSDLKVEYLSYTDTPKSGGGVIRTTSIDLTFLVKDKNLDLIFIVRPKHPVSSQVVSVDGDRFYQVLNFAKKERNCQGFERSLDVTFQNFSTEYIDQITTTLDGRVNLLEVQWNEKRKDQLFVDSAFTTLVKQGNVTSRYEMSAYNVEKAVDLTKQSYSYEFDGLVKNDSVFNGTLWVTPTGKLYGNFASDYPSSGFFEVKGKGLERVFVVPDIDTIQLRVDHNGDALGNGFSDFDLFIDSTWADLTSKQFKESM